jgi:hypothetical protein
MKVRCPFCGKSVLVKGLGRKPLRISVRNVSDALQTFQSVEAAANHLGCSKAYVFNKLKANGLTLKDIAAKRG